jgi:hemerythrin-like domain-containing protein
LDDKLSGGRHWFERDEQSSRKLAEVIVEDGNASYADILVAQHNRGREITDYIISVTQGTKLGTSNVEPLAKSLEAFVLMYRNHAAREDTIIFPAWKQTMTGEQLDEMNDKFEDIEHEQFGEDGFEDAVKQISAIESRLGLADISQFTAPAPPKV